MLNTQQIPSKRTEVRRLFTPSSEERIFIAVDYSQIELRVLAHLANESVLIEAFENGKDIHSTTAAMISGGKYSYEDIERDKDTEGHACQKLRKQAKVVNFGIVYGMGAGKLSDTLEITKKQAQNLIDGYFAGYPGIKGYMEQQHATVEKYGHVTDIYGRKRRLDREIKESKNGDRWMLFAAQRQAGNFPIQASAGTILKQAIVDLQDYIASKDVHILLQVHDEIVFDCPKDVEKETVLEIKNIMEKAVELVVPVNCDVEISPTQWMENLTIDEWFKSN